MSRKELATQIATQLLQLIDRALQRSLTDDPNQHTRSTCVVDLAIATLRTVITGLERFVTEHDFLSACVGIGAIAAVSFGVGRVVVRRIQIFVVLVRRRISIRISIRIGVLREYVFGLLRTGAKQHLSQASEGDVFVSQQVEQFTVRRDQQFDHFVVGVFKLCLDTLIECHQIIGLQLDDFRCWL